MNVENKEEAKRRSVQSNDAVVMMPPYVEPEHRQLIEKAELALEEYSEYLLKIVTQELFDNGRVTDPHPADVIKAEKRFHEDKIRLELARILGNIKLMCERPRILIRPS